MTISAVIETVAKGLPPTFLALCALNAVFLLGFGWFVLRVAEMREAREAPRLALLTQLVTACLQKQETRL